MITSKNNETIKQLIKLQQKKYRIKEQKYIVSKPNIIAEAITTNQTFERISCVDNTANYYVSKELIQKITNDDFNEAIILKINETKITENENCIVLDNVCDPGNMGTILRTALAFGITNVVISENSVDIYNPKVISAMQGCHFHQKIEYKNLDDFFQNNTNVNIMSYLSEPNNKPKKVEQKFNLVVGNEGNGINERYKKYMDYNYLIEIEFESLNVAIAAGIMIHDLTRS